MEGSKDAGEGTEGLKVSSGTFATASKDRGSNEEEGTVDSIRLVVTFGKSKGEGSRATAVHWETGRSSFLVSEGSEASLVPPSC